jgi:hypothetical protein
VHTDRPCGNDEDCDNEGQPPPCAICQNNETCVRVLSTPPELFLEPGESVVLLDQPVVLRNKFADLAKMLDTWTAITTLPAFSADAVVKYKIKARPNL